ncbi:hypothetical protein [Pollutibacter soli]|uniref:hypothetical protein n=1 Tax=Pollutibacter soli TaxID=3034157 RepID=UPI0030136751
MLLDISSWWNSLVLFEKVLWGISLLFSLLFLFQLILTLTGGDADSFGDADEYADGDDGADNQYFTIKNLVAFFTMFGWAGIAAYSSGLAKWLVIILALIAGLIMVFLMVLLFKNISRLKHSGTMEINNAIDQVAETYLFIPSGRNGMGKVHVKFQGGLHELQAMTDDSEDIPTGKIVKVTGVINDSILLVTAYTRF